MSTLVAPPEIFSAHALAAFHPADYGFEGQPDPVLAKGSHIRIFAGTTESFPIAPFAVFRVSSFESELFSVTARDAAVEGQTVILGESEASIGLVLPRLDGGALVRVDLLPAGHIRRAALYDPSGRLVQARAAAGWQFSAPILQRFQVLGEGRVRIAPRFVDIRQLLERDTDDAPDSVLGLPAWDAAGGGRHRWYLVLDNEATALDRVARGAPLCLTPMDRPVGPFASPPGAEMERVIRLLDVDRDFRIRLWKMLDGDGPPWAQERNKLVATPANRASQTLHLPVAGMLQTACLDPGLARYFGFAGHFDVPPQLLRGAGAAADWDTFAIVGLFALDPRLVERLAIQVEQPDAADPRRLINLLLRTFQRRERDLNIAGEMASLIRKVQGEGLVVAPFVTFAAPVLPPLTPDIPAIELVSHLWQMAPDRRQPSDHYRAGFAFPDLPMVAMAAMRRDVGGVPEARHRHFDTDTVVARAVPRLFGYELEANSRHRLFARTRRDQRPAALLADEDIPVQDGGAAYRFAGADIFGRFGSWSDAQALGPPPRPLPPAPVLVGHIENRTQGLDADGALSMGTLRLAIASPLADGEPFTDEQRRQHGRMIVVPRLDERPAGALPLKVLHLQFGDQQRDILTDRSGVQEIEFPLPDLVPTKTRDSAVLTGCFVDSDGRKGPDATRIFEFVELRPPPVHETGVGLYWTSAPGPAPEVELDLEWQGHAGVGYRVYLTDAVGLGLDVSAASMSRGEVAVTGCRRVLDAEVVPRDRFRLLTPQPLQTDPDLRVRFTHKLPRALTIVQFLRVVPVGPAGGEPSFDRCPIVPLAVPESRRPAAPWLHGEIDPATGSPRLRVIADGFNLSALSREEPGLFDGGELGREPPRYRLRSSVSALPDPIYARVAAEGAMALAPEMDRFEAEWTGPPLEPFVRYAFWSEVQLPPERCGPAALDLTPPDNGVAPPDEASRSAFRRPYSRVSAGRTLVRLPSEPPALLDPARVTARRDTTPAGNVALTIELVEPPRAHPKAIERYRLALWSQWPEREIEAVGEQPQQWPNIESGLAVVEIGIPDGVESDATLTVRLALVDPAGRLGPILNLEVPGAPPPATPPTRKVTKRRERLRR